VKFNIDVMYKNIIFDFDGVLVDSNQIRVDGFKKMYSKCPPAILDTFIRYVSLNHGFSRYKKIKYYYKELLNQNVTENVVQQDASHYSLLVAKAVEAAKEVPGAEAFLNSARGNFSFALISSSDQRELCQICRHRRIDQYFEAILGSPVEKSLNIINFLEASQWQRNKTVYVGDSVSDFEAASSAGIAFIGFGSTNFHSYDKIFTSVDNFNELSQLLLRQREKT